MPWVTPLVVAAAVSGPVQPPADATKDLVKVSLLLRDTHVAPGHTLQVGVVFEIKKDWHIYWPGQNDSGSPTVIRLTFPEGSGLTAGAARFPNPRRYLQPGDILDYALEGKVIVTVPVTIPKGATVGKEIPIKADVEFLVCNESCIPGEASVSGSVQVAEKSHGSPTAQRAIDAALAALPKAQSDGLSDVASLAWEPQSRPTQGQADTASPLVLAVTVKDPAATRVTFYPADGGAKLLNPAIGGEVALPARPLRLAFETGARAPEQVAGVLEIASGNTLRSWSLSLPRPTNPTVGGPVVLPTAPLRDASPVTPAAKP